MRWNCNGNPIVFENFYQKCRDNGELPLKNDDFALKTGEFLLQFEVRARHIIVMRWMGRHHGTDLRLIYNLCDFTVL